MKDIINRAIRSNFEYWGLYKEWGKYGFGNGSRKGSGNVFIKGNGWGNGLLNGFEKGKGYGYGYEDGNGISRIR
jgi:hypothetical protein